MKKIGFALILFIAVRCSLWALPGAPPCIFKIENLLTKESVTYRTEDLIYNIGDGYQTPIITFSKGIYALDVIKITMLNSYGYYFTVYGWTSAYNSQQESVLEEGNVNDYVREISITHCIPGVLNQDNMSMNICAYVGIPVGLAKGNGDEAEGEALFSGTRYRFRFSGLHNTKRYTIREDLGDIIIGPPIVIVPPTSSNKVSASVARLYDGFGNLKKTVSLNNSGETRIHVGDLKHGIYLLKLTIDGMEFTEKINL